MDGTRWGGPEYDATIAERDAEAWHAVHELIAAAHARARELRVEAQRLDDLAATWDAISSLVASKKVAPWPADLEAPSLRALPG